MVMKGVIYWNGGIPFLYYRRERERGEGEREREREREIERERGRGRERGEIHMCVHPCTRILDILSHSSVYTHKNLNTYTSFNTFSTHFKLREYKFYAHMY